MKSIHISTVICAVVFLLASSARAALTISLQEIPITPAAIANDPNLANFVCVDLVVNNSPPNAFNVAGMITEPITPGFFYQHPFGGLTRPSPALVNLFPAVGFDSYITTPAEILFGTTPDSPGGYTGTQGTRMTDSQLNVVWGSPPPPQVFGEFHIARITFNGR
jgi:hypothetical protein